MGDLFIGIALLIAGTVVGMRSNTRWYGAFIVGGIETVHGLYLLSKGGKSTKSTASSSTTKKL